MGRVPGLVGHPYPLVERPSDLLFETHLVENELFAPPQKQLSNITMLNHISIMPHTPCNHKD